MSRHSVSEIESDADADANEDARDCCFEGRGGRTTLEDASKAATTPTVCELFKGFTVRAMPSVEKNKDPSKSVPGCCCWMSAVGCCECCRARLDIWALSFCLVNLLKE